MEAETKRFLIKFSIFSLIIIGIATILFISVLKPYYVKAFPLQVLLIGTFTVLSHLHLIKALGKSIQVFTNTFILSITLKLMLYFMFLLVCLLIDNTNALSFVVTFFALYICYTSFEVIQLLNVKKK
jgi:hypothetical protein